MDIKKPISERLTRTKIIVFAVSVLLIAAVVIVALNPAKQLAKMRNDQRRSDAMLILDALYQYSSDKGGGAIDLPQSPKEICKSSADCNGLVDLGALTAGKKYLPAVPSDPKNNSANGTGYQISKNANGRITVSAIAPEDGAVITVTR